MNTPQAFVPGTRCHSALALLICLGACAASAHQAVCDDRPGADTAAEVFDPTQAVLTQVSMLDVGRNGVAQDCRRVKKLNRPQSSLTIRF
ncbi:MAG: hypothetical protein ABGZ53_15890 [Fuerstiella sp.]